jgi:hypothetical protein
MASLVLLKNPLTPNDRQAFPLEDGVPVIDWLQEHHPDGFGMPIKFYVNGEEKPLDDLDYIPSEDDVVVIAMMPGGFLAAMPLLVKVVIGLAVMAASYFAMMLFAPKQPKKQKAAEEKETFNVSSDQNAARVGDPIPVVYGDVWMYPDYAAQPYTWYSWNETGWNEWLSGVQYLDIIMCVGQGVVEVTDVKVGSSSAASLGTEIVQWRSFLSSEHKSTVGNIQANMPQGFFENVITCPDVENQEFIKYADQSVFYTIGKAGQTGRFFQFDIIFPNGLFYAGGSSGNMKGATCGLNVYWQEVDANGNLFGPIAQMHLGVNAAPGHLGESKNKAEISNPIRRTWTIDTGKSARWAVKLFRTTHPYDTNEGQSTFIWSGLKLLADSPANIYGNVTLLAVRVKASRGVGADAAVRIMARCKRWSWGLPDGGWQHSTNPADAFYDIYTDTNYGASRPVAELDMPALRNLKNKWAGYQFNYVFRDRTTVWEALKLSALGQAAEPLPQGSFMSIAQDGVKPLRSMLFTDANIVEGTMKVNYLFDVEENSDGVEVSHINPLDWSEAFVRYPTNSVIPETVSLAGCTSSTHAAEYARLVWQRTRKQRKRITFDTELEGIILQLGDRIAVSHEMPRWGDNGIVLEITGNQVTVDKSLDWSGGAKFMMFRKADGTPSELYTVTQGSKPNIALLATPLTFAPHIDDAYDYTAFVFGSATTIVQDFTVATTRHSNDTVVSIEAVNYAPEIFDGAMSFLR